jgi:serine/threonine-protein kinase SRPK3
LFRLSPHVIKWSDAEVYAHLGDPETENVRTRDRQPPGPHAPAMLVAPIENSKMSDATLLQESIIISDFGQSYIGASPPSSYEAGTVLNYQSPEARFEGRVGLEADTWALGCATFEIRAGFALFESFLGSDVDILRQTVQELSPDGILHAVDLLDVKALQCYPKTIPAISKVRRAVIFETLVVEIVTIQHKPL